MSRPTSLSSWPRKAIACAAALALQVQLVSPALAALAQSPLLASSGSQPAPNVMLTLDTSGSMNFRHMPEYRVYFSLPPDSKGNPRNEKLTVAGTNTWINHPQDTYESSVEYAGVMPGDPNEKDPARLQSQVHLRSPDVNTIYYNPQFRYRPWVKADGTRMQEANFKKAYIDPLNQTATDKAIDLSQSATTCLVERKWEPLIGWTCDKPALINAAMYYLLKPRPASQPEVWASVPSNYVLYDLNGKPPQLVRYSLRDDCAADPCTLDEERANFANWFVYYRTRLLLTKAALSEAFYKLDNVARFGWTTLRYAASAENRTKPILQPLKPLDTQHRANFLKTLQSDMKNFNADGSTPLIDAVDQVGKYFMDSAAATNPWRDNLAVDGGKKSECRRSYNILTTDGYYTDPGIKDGEERDIGDVDGTGAVSGTVVRSDYTPAAPYWDGMVDGKQLSYKNSLADFAMKYWLTDLQDIDNKVSVTARDPATWQHLTQFAVGIGVRGELDPQKDLDALTNGTKHWPDPGAGSAPRADDLWHAAINSRGKFYSVRNASDLKAAINDALLQASADDLREGGVALAGQTAETAHRRYVPAYDEGAWRGHLYAVPLDAKGHTQGSPVWDAADKLPPAANRKLLTTDPFTGTVVKFEYSSLSDKTRALITRGATEKDYDEKLINYLRGSGQNEGTEEGLFRTRPGTKLPDLVNSPPTFVKDHVNLKYGELDVGKEGAYAKFLESKAARLAAIFVGGNGGFLHAFNESDGAEIFGYAPRGVLGNLYKLASQDYGLKGRGLEHQYFVDGPTVESDAYFKPAGSASADWRNVLVGTLGGGGKGLYAIDVTVLSELGAASVLWDKTFATDGADAPPEVGHIYASPQVGVLPDGSWKVFVGNGYESSGGRAALLMYDMATGALESLPVGPTGNNGLGGVVLLRDAKQQVVAAYAGDLQGNLWRFEYDATTSKMVVGYNSKPFFTALSSAGVSQPITVSPAVIPRLAGNMVLFGTGRLLTTDDKANTSARQTVYGLVDKNGATVSTKAIDPPFNPLIPARDGALVGQVISPTADPKRFSVTSNPQNGNSKGWYMDLTITDGQRVIYPIQTLGTAVLISSIVPSETAAECDEKSGKGYNFLLSGLSGAQYALPTFDTNGDGLINSSDRPDAGYEATSADGGDQFVRKEGGGGKEGTGCQIHNTRGEEDCQLPGDKTNYKIVDRVWKRLINDIPQPK